MPDRECPVTCGRMIRESEMPAHLAYHETHPPYESLDFDAPDAMTTLVGKEVEGPLGPGRVVVLRNGRLGVSQVLTCDEGVSEGKGSTCPNEPLTAYVTPNGNGAVYDFSGRYLADLRNDMYYCSKHLSGRRRIPLGVAQMRPQREWQTRRSLFITWLREVDMRIWVGVALCLLGVALVLVSVLISLACPGAVVLWFGLGLVSVGIGLVVITPGAWPATVVLVIVGVGLSLFGFLSASAAGCSIFL